VGKTGAFLSIQRHKQPARHVEERIRDWGEVYLPYPDQAIHGQAARCMDCGIPFCHQGCPLANVVPDWNDLVYGGQWQSALAHLHATNNFPEWTGRLCPAPCEGSCVLSLHDEAVTIRSIELTIAERGFAEGWIAPHPPTQRTGKHVAVIGSGPAGLAAADQLNHAGHLVTVFERSDRIGGLLRYGIPEFKMEKHVLDRRLAVMSQEGVVFRPGTNVGVDVTLGDLRRDFNALVLALGAGRPRDLLVPGRELAGIHFAVPFLTQQNRRCEGDVVPDTEAISAAGKRVVIIGGGDTGADCLGTLLRQGVRSVHQFELLPQPPLSRAPDNPWPQWPNVLRVSAAHEEGGERLYSVSTRRFIGDERGHLRKLEAVRVEMVHDNGHTSFNPIPDSGFELEVDLALLAMGFTGPESSPLLRELGVKLTEQGTVWKDPNWMTSVPGVFVAGDMERGQSLIVWAIASGRSAARGVDARLMGGSHLPAPIS